MNITISDSTAQLLGMDPGIWMNFFGIIVGLVSVAIITPAISRRNAARDQQERLLRTLLNTWQTPANPDYQAALALIPVDFKKSHKIKIARQELIGLTNKTPTPDDEARHFSQVKEAQADLICQIAKQLGHDISKGSLVAGAYTSKGWADREILINAALHAWTRVADALEMSNEMQRQYITTPVSPSEREPAGAPV